MSSGSGSSNTPMSSVQYSTISAGQRFPASIAYDPHIPQSRLDITTMSSVGEDGKIGMGHNNIHIQPSNNGFIVTVVSKDEGIRTYTFDEFEKVVAFISELCIMTLDDERVADNV